MFLWKMDGEGDCHTGGMAEGIITTTDAEFRGILEGRSEEVTAIALAAPRRATRSWASALRVVAWMVSSVTCGSSIGPAPRAMRRLGVSSVTAVGRTSIARATCSAMAGSRCSIRTRAVSPRAS